MPNSWYEPTITCPVCKGTGRAKGSSILGCNKCLGRGTVSSVSMRASSPQTVQPIVEVGQTWYVQLYERATLTKWRVADLTDKTIELSKDQPAGHPPVVYRYRRDEVRLVERVS